MKDKITLNVLSITGNTARENGILLYDEILKCFMQNKSVTVSFKDIDYVSSGYVQFGLTPLLETYDMEYIKANLSFVDSTKQINDQIRRGFKVEVERLEKLKNEN